MSDYYFSSQYNSTNVRDKWDWHKIIGLWLRGLFILSPGLARWAVKQLFFSPKRLGTSPEEKAWLKRGRPFRIQVHDKTIHAWRWGHGPAVLLVHGWSGSGIQFQRFIEPLLQSGYSAIAFDGPAHGASSGRITSYFEFTDTIRQLLARKRDLNIRGIVAHSFGAAAVINALAKEDLFVNTVLVAPILKLQELLHRTFYQYGVPKSLYLPLIKQFEIRFGYHLTRDNPHRLMADLAGPVLIVHDTADRTVPFRDSAEQARRFEQIDLLPTTGMGHRRVLDDPQVIASCIARMGDPIPHR